MTDEDVIQEYGQILTTELATEYGLWSDVDKDWWVLDTGEIFHTTSLAIARAQLHHIEKIHHNIQELNYAIQQIE